MALDLRDTRRPGPRPRPGASPRASRSLAHPREIPPVAAKAWETSALVRTPPASHRAPPNTATPPRSAMLRTQISQSLEFRSRRRSPLIILHHRRHQPRRKLLRHAVQCRVLLFKKVPNTACVVHVRGNLVLIAENKIVRVIENLPRLAFFERDLALQGNQHGGRAPRRRIKQQRYRFHTQDLAPQHRIRVRRIRYHAIGSLR